jgi:hypothetical protein
VGLDFVTKCTPSFKRSWDRGRTELMEPDLFSRHPQLEGRTFRLRPTGEQQVAPGEEVLLRWHGGELLAFRGHEWLGQVSNPPASLVTAITQAGDALCARVEKVHRRSGAADISIVP